jgi:hypothetical protein
VNVWVNSIKSAALYISPKRRLASKRVWVSFEARLSRLEVRVTQFETGSEQHVPDSLNGFHRVARTTFIDHIYGDDFEQGLRQIARRVARPKISVLEYGAGESTRIFAEEFAESPLVAGEMKSALDASAGPARPTAALP